MARIEVYANSSAPIARGRRRCAENKGAAFEEISVTMDRAGFDAMVARAGGRRTVPQVFIDGQHIGGSDDLAALDAGRARPAARRGLTLDRLRSLLRRQGSPVRGLVCEQRQLRRPAGP